MTQLNDSTTSSEPQLVEFGPYRVVGSRCAAKNENGEFSQLWERDFLPRLQEIRKADGADFFVGLCRCLPEVSDGTFEYIAAMPAAAAAPIPDGMIDAPIAAATYVVFPVNGLAEIMQGWGQLGPWFQAHPEWEGYCTPGNCECATHPSFELYPANFGVDGKLFIYMPVRKKNATG